MIRSPWTLVLTLGLLTATPGASLACLWDYDTLKQERSRFPDTLELITGKFLRHSTEFYEWRIADRKARLEQEPDNLALYDDLAVAYDKVGQTQKAIETILAKDKRKPGLYETESNLATFSVHAGQLDRSLQHVERALQINPDAHFGREKYQKLLVEYLVQRRKAKGDQLPLATIARSPNKDADGTEDLLEVDFDAFLWPRNGGRTVPPEERKAAIKGVLGMMRFARHDSPLLLEALGWLLLHGDGFDRDNDGKRLAARAFLKAAYASKDEAKRGYRVLARKALQFQTVHPQTHDALPLEQLENDFQQELADANRWYAEVREDELRWIKEGKNPEEEFDRKYYAEPKLSSDDSEPEKVSWWWRPGVRLGAGAVSLLVVLALFLCFLRCSSRWSNFQSGE